MADPAKFVTIGRIGPTHGIKGWVKIISYTQPAENIFEYGPWQIGKNNHWHPVVISEIRSHGDSFIVKLLRFDTPESAATLKGAEIAVSRDQLPALESDEYYWADLEGLTVFNEENICLGTVISLFETGANDVIVVKGEHKQYLIPYVPDMYVLSIDLANKRMQVRWNAEI